MRGAVGDAAGAIFQNLTCMLFGLLIAFAYDWRMALVVFGALPLIVVATTIQMKFTAGLNTKSDELYSQANQTATEALSAMRTIHAYNLQARDHAVVLILILGSCCLLFCHA